MGSPRAHTLAQRTANHGRRFGQLTAIRPLPRVKNRSVVWLLRCDCGATEQRTLSGARWSVSRGFIPKCKACREILCCSVCHEPGHQRRTCAKRTLPQPKHCPACQDLPHRRPRVGMCRCGKTYREDAA